MKPLPAIPLDSWVADQQDLFSRQIKNYIPALEFDAVTRDQENATISPDWPYPTSAEDWQQVQDEQAAQQRRLEEQRQLLAAQQAQQAEQERQQTLAAQATQFAQSLGIPTPDDVFSVFQSAVGTPPGTGDNRSTTGVFEPGTQPVGMPSGPPSTSDATNIDPEMRTPADVGEYPPYGSIAGVIDQKPNIETNGEPAGRFTPMRNYEDFDQYAAGLNNEFFPPPSPQETAADRRGRAFTEAVSNAPSAIWNTAKDIGTAVANLPGQAYEAGQQLGDAVLNAPSVNDLALEAGRRMAPAVRDIGEREAKGLSDLPGGAARAIPDITAYAYGGILPEVSGIATDAAEAAAKQTHEQAVGSVPTSIEEIPEALKNVAIRSAKQAFLPTVFSPASEDIQNIQNAATGAIGRRVAKDLGVSDQPIATIMGTPVSAQDIAAEGAKLALDPMNWVGAGEAETAANVARRLPDSGMPGTIHRAASALWNMGTEAVAPIVRKADDLAGYGLEGSGRIGKYALGKAAENPEATGMLAGATLDRTLNPDQDPGTNIGAGIGVAGAVRAARLPMTKRAASGAMQMFHGTGIDFLKPLAKKFDPDGLFGPAYYLTSDPRVAATYAEGKAQPSNYDLVEWAKNEYIRHADTRNKLMNDLTPEDFRIINRKYANHVNDELLPDALDDPLLTANQRKYLEAQLAESKAWKTWQDSEDHPQFSLGQNIRPVDLDANARLFHADRQVPSADWNRIIGALDRLYGEDPDLAELIQQYRAAVRGGEKTTGEALYTSLAADFGQMPPLIKPTGDFVKDYQALQNVDLEGEKAIANRILSEAGFDGIYYKGGRLNIPNPETGQTIQHDAVAMFPDKIADVLRQSYTREPMGNEPIRIGNKIVPPDAVQRLARPVADEATRLGVPTGAISGAIGGGVTGALSGDEDTTWQERAQNALAGASIGAVLGGASVTAAARYGLLGAARFIDSRIQRGIIDPEIFLSHPSEYNRIKTLMGLMTEGMPDNMPVHIPDAVSYRLRQMGDDAARAAGLDFLRNPDLTVGDVRAGIAQTTSWQQFQQDTAAMLVDALRGTNKRTQRAAETRADIATVKGIPENLWNALDVREPFSRPNEPAYHPDVGNMYPIPDEMPWASPAGQRVQDIVTELARNMGVQRPEVRLIPRPENNAYAIPMMDEPSMLGITRGLLSDPEVTDGEFRSVIQHELGHLAEQNAAYGREPSQILANEAADLPLPKPKTGDWKERLDQGIQIPEGATEAEGKRLTDLWNRAIDQYKKVQTTKRASLRMRWGSDAERYWNIYQENLDRISARRSRTPAAGERVAAPPEATPIERPAAEPAPEPTLEPTPEGPTPPAPEPVLEPRDATGEASPGSEAIPEEGVGNAADDLSFEEPLPTELDPRRVFTHEEAGKLLSQLHESLAAQPTDQAWADRQAALLMGQPKIWGRFIQKILDGVGERRALPRYGDVAEQARNYTTKFLQDNGWIARGERNISGPVEETLAPEQGLLESRVGRELAQRLPGAGEGALLGAAVQDPEDDDNNNRLTGPLAGAAVGGILGRKINQKILDDPSIYDHGVMMYAEPNARNVFSHKGAFERVHDFWRNQFVSKATDYLSALQGWQNDMAREFQKQTGRALPAKYLVAEQARFTATPQTTAEIDEHYKPYLQMIRRAGVPIEVADRYLMAKQNRDIALAQGKEQVVSGVKMFVPNLKRQFPGNTTYADEMKWLMNADNTKLHLSPEDWQMFQDGIKGVQGFAERYLGKLRDAGMITPENYNEWRAKYPNYVPTRIIEKLQDDGFVPRGKGLSVNSNTIHELTTLGTTKDAMSPTAALAAEAARIDAAIQKNTVSNMFADLWGLSSGELTERGFTPPVAGTPGLSSEARRIARYAEGVTPLQASAGTVSGTKPVSFFRNGEKMKLQVDEQMGNLINFPSPTVVPVLSGLMGLFRAVTTGRNPLFIPANMLLDYSSVLQRESAREATSMAPWELGRAASVVTGEWLKNMAKYTLTPRSWGYMLKNELPPELADIMRQGGGMSGGHYRMSGIPQGDWGQIPLPGGGQFDLNRIRNPIFGHGSEASQYVRELSRDFLEIHDAKSLMTEVGRIMKNVATFKPVERYGQMVELASRKPAYDLQLRRTAKEIAPLQTELDSAMNVMAGGRTAQEKAARLQASGLRSPEELQSMIDDIRQRGQMQAVQNFRTTTLDFDKGGTFVKAINQMVPFFNVGVQSMVDPFRALGEEKGRKYAAMTAATVIAPVMAAEAWNNSDPQMARDYADIPDDIKDQGVVFMLPKEWVGDAPIDEQGNRHPQFFLFRYRQLAPLAMMTRAMMKNTFFPDSMPEEEQRSWARAIASGWTQYTPIPASNALDTMQSFLPPGIGTAFQLAQDKNTFTGRKITSTYADERASPLSHALADVTGIGRPSQWEFGTRDFLGGPAQMAHGASQIPQQISGEIATTPQNAPFVGGPYGRWVRGSIGGQAQRAEENVVTPSAEALLKQHRITWRPEAASPEIKNVPLTRVEYAEYQREINKQTDKVMHAVMEDPRFATLTKADREAYLKQQVEKTRSYVQDYYLQKIPAEERRKRLQREIEKQHLTTRGTR